MHNFKKLRVKVEIRDYVDGEDLYGVEKISTRSLPRPGGKIIRDPADHKRMWYISPAEFYRTYATKEEREMLDRTN